MCVFRSNRIPLWPEMLLEVLKLIFGGARLCRKRQQGRSICIRNMPVDAETNAIHKLIDKKKNPSWKAKFQSTAGLSSESASSRNCIL